MKAKVTIQVEIDTANYPDYDDSAEGVKNIAEDITICTVELVEKPTIVVEPLPNG